MRKILVKHPPLLVASVLHMLDLRNLLDLRHLLLWHLLELLLLRHLLKLLLRHLLELLLLRHLLKLLLLWHLLELLLRHLLELLALRRRRRRRLLPLLVVLRVDSGRISVLRVAWRAQHRGHEDEQRAISHGFDYTVCVCPPKLQMRMKRKMRVNSHSPVGKLVTILTKRNHIDFTSVCKDTILLWSRNYRHSSQLM